jgi:GTP-binding protein LepA
LVFDAEYNAYRGVVLLVRVKEGRLRVGQRIHFIHTGADYTIEELGLQQLSRTPLEELSAGAVGYVIAGIKAIRDIAIGDTITDAEHPAAAALPGYTPAKPVVFSSIYPVASDDYDDLVAAFDKLALNDAALTFTKVSSTALGLGFRCGFLGLLHLDVVQERLQREYDMSVILSAPSVRYELTLKSGETAAIENPSEFPDPTLIETIAEPYIRASLLIPEGYLGVVLDLVREFRAAEIAFDYLSVGRIEVKAAMPLGEVLFDFYDRLKSITRGHGSFDYELLDYRPSDIVKVDILVNGEQVDALSQLVHRDKARQRGLHYCERLAESIPRHQFKIPIQGTIGGKIIARTTVQAFRKDVTAKCYGGDITRKRKLLEKQKAGKKRMKAFGSVEIPQDAFVSVLKSRTDS